MAAQSSKLTIRLAHKTGANKHTHIRASTQYPCALETLTLPDAGACEPTNGMLVLLAPRYRPHICTRYGLALIGVPTDTGELKTPRVLVTGLTRRTRPELV